ncbi:McbB family protein [Bacillus wiedmannii]|uniref:McbB family protein n=1 Tax=Bacillus wiedmannii TaxID=1890302 RepID=A0A2B5P4S5_9BACI|nr:McbB family protein [Bacillus wiedmannii]MBG9855633.1 hypothetical protein [Bacillus wiedmannii]MDM5265478.1 McbB family protein [Bacillus wiedmannii]MEE3949439.1 McbB family protein [Bacillus wiedmannii]PDY42074.1 McbB family protein [Bacillus wiedmannii]PFZ92777.1 McbB family protein [Bacillus wiedmannii]
MIITSEYFMVGNSIFYELPNGSFVVQNQAGIVKVEDEEMISFIKGVDINNKKRIELKELEELFKERTEDALEFLIAYNIIQKPQNTNYNLKEITILTNNRKIRDHFSFFSDSLDSELTTNVKYVSESSEIHISEGELLVAFLNPYNKSIAQSVMNALNQSENTLLLMSYIYNNKFYIDPLYNPKWKNPCHRCHIGYIESQLRVNEFGGLSYQALIDVIYHEDPKFHTESPLSTVDVYNIITLLLNQLDRFVIRTKGNILLSHESLEDINNTICYDLTTKILSKDISTYWELCDCYE